jgi:hypothetical protein
MDNVLARCFPAMVHRRTPVRHCVEESLELWKADKGILETSRILRLALLAILVSDLVALILVRLGRYDMTGLAPLFQSPVKLGPVNNHFWLLAHFDFSIPTTSNSGAVCAQERSWVLPIGRRGPAAVYP